jgi:hypothetical protein
MSTAVVYYMQAQNIHNYKRIQNETHKWMEKLKFY